jgi:site-specific DNA recombinase
MTQKGEAKSKLRVVGYCRTSGEGQRDNTSIPTQKEYIEAFCKNSGWRFLTHYVDESRSGAKVAGREAFQKMIKDAALEKFDMIVAYDVTRFARDGVDILNNAKFLRENFNVHVVDTKGGFDSRPGRNILLNFVHAGVSEQERITILDRTVNGRIKKARNGEPWSGHLPFGRGYDKHTKKWFITERGHRYRQLLERYVAGEGLHKLVTTDFPEFRSSQFVNCIFRRSKVAGPYIKTFQAKELNVRETVSIPGIPEIISLEFAKKVQDRMTHRRVCNKEDFQTYLLTGFVRCGHCGRLLSGSLVKGIKYHRHHSRPSGSRLCVFYGIREDELVPPVLDLLFRIITDGAALNAALEKALPDAKVRPALEQDRDELKAKIATTDLQIRRLVDAIAKGADPAYLIGKQRELRQKQEQEYERLSEVEERLAEIPEAAAVKAEADAIHLHLLHLMRNRDWRKLSYDEIRRYLIFVFGENPAKAGNGIEVRRIGKKWNISFKGRFTFGHDIVNGQVIRHTVRIEADRHNKEVKRMLEKVKGDVGNMKGNTGFRGMQIR